MCVHMYNVYVAGSHMPQCSYGGQRTHLDINPLFSPWVLEIELRAPGLHGKMTQWPAESSCWLQLYYFFKKHSCSCIVWGWIVLCPISMTLLILPFHVFLSSNSHVFKNLEAHSCWHLWMFLCGWKTCWGPAASPHSARRFEGWLIVRHHCC